MVRTSWASPVCLVHLVYLVGLVYPVYLVHFVQPNTPDRPNRPYEQDRLADFFSILLVVRAYEGESIVSRRAGKRDAGQLVDGARCSDVRWIPVICEDVGTTVALY